MLRLKRLLLFLVSAICITAAGCGRSNFATVDGTVSLNGQKLDGGTVTFTPDAPGPLAYADIGSDGSFHLKTASIDGAALGSYVATVSYRSGPTSYGMSIREIEALEKVPIRYCTRDTSDLRFEVKPGHNSFELKMTSK